MVSRNSYFERNDLYTCNNLLSAMPESLLIQLTGERPVFKIIDFLIENKGMDFSKKQIMEGAGISKATLFAYWPVLEKHNIVKVMRTFGKTKLYTINSSNPIIKKILELESTLIRQSMAAAARDRVELPALKVR